MNTFNLNLDLDKTSGIIQWVTLRQGDKNGTQLRATIYDHGTPVTGNYTARFSLRHPGTGDTYYRETATYNNGVATVTVDEQYAATVTGITAGYFELLQGSTVIASTADFGVRILASATDGAVPGEVYDSAIEDALAELDEATGHINQMVVDATEEYLNAHPELTTTVEDNSLTDAKLIQQGGILSRVDRLMYRLDNLLTNTPAEAESVTVTDAAKTPVAGLALYGKSTQDGTPTPSAPVPIQSVTAPNILPTDRTTMVAANIVGTWEGNSYTRAGVTFACDFDENGLLLSATISGTNTSPSYLTVAPSGYQLSAGAYTMSSLNGGIQTSNNKPYIYIKYGSSYKYEYNGSFTLTSDATLDFGAVFVPAGTWDGITVYPMLVAGTSAYAYVPYGCAGLWARGRNLLRNIASAGTNHGVTFTMNADGSVTAIGTTPTGEQASATLNAFVALKAGNTYTLSGCPANGGNGKWHLYFSGSSSYYDNGAGTTFTPESDMVGSVIIRIYAGQTVNFTFYPQLELGSTAHAYQPYTETVTPIPLDGHTLRSLPDGTRDEVNVDERGHVTLTQRVGVWDISETAQKTWKKSSSALNGYYTSIGNLGTTNTRPATYQNGSVYCTVAIGASSQSDYFSNYDRTWIDNSFSLNLDPLVVGSTVSDFNSWLASADVKLIAEIATPVTYDLGTIDPVPLVGPDMTAQAVPTTPFALTYERDLNVTLARLEAAIADAATA